MMNEEDVKTLSVEEAKQLSKVEDVVFVDVRDPQSFESEHIPHAIHVNDHNLQNFINTSDKSKTHILYCYHGHASIGGAAYFQKQGFEKVYSMDGGFSKWSYDTPNNEQ